MACVISADNKHCDPCCPTEPSCPGNVKYQVKHLQEQFTSIVESGQNVESALEYVLPEAQAKFIGEFCGTGGCCVQAGPFAAILGQSLNYKVTFIPEDTIVKPDGSVLATSLIILTQPNVRSIVSQSTVKWIPLEDCQYMISDASIVSLACQPDVQLPCSQCPTP